MSRSLLAVCLLLFAGASLAGDLTAGDDSVGSGAKPGKTVLPSNTPDGDTTTGGHATSTPARGNGTVHTVMPRWHSLLPGMIR